MHARLWFMVALGTTAWAQDAGWSCYGGDAGGSRYSRLEQVNRGNVGRLQVAWTYRTGALEPVTDLNRKAAFEATPILVDGALYLSTPFDQVIALDPATGAQRWKYDPAINRSHDYSEVTSRGVSAWRGRRIFIGTIDARLIALDAKTGRPCGDFGDNGQIDLTRGVDLRDRGQYQVTSPPAVVGDLVIVGSAIGDNRAVELERGIVRAFDVQTGRLRWTWDPIPWATHQRVRTGAANAWSAMSADPERGLVFIPTGSASPDFYGGERPGDNRWANSVVALRASSGELVWGFQVVHHDLWDYDAASQPALFTFRGKTPAVAMNTKMGSLFLLDRITGKPLFPVEERPVPKSDVAGEQASSTQPVPVVMPLLDQVFRPADEWCEQRTKSLRYDGLFTPPSIGGSLEYPGNVGGVNWGSAAIDPVRGVLVANTNHLAFIVRLIPRDKLESEFSSGNRNWGEFARQTGTPFGLYREPFMDPDSRPCTKPPWGTLSAVDLNHGRRLWEAPLPSINLGGPIATAGGLVFDAAATDERLRAFDIDTGRELWSAPLPASAQATPMTYAAGGKQYVVICAGGHGKAHTKQGDYVVAFALR